MTCAGFAGSIHDQEGALHARHGGPTPQSDPESLRRRLRVNGLAPKAVIGAAMRKLVRLIYGVVRSGEPFRPHSCLPALDSKDGI